MGRYGICLLSVVPVRFESSDKSEITTQMIFGDLFELLETSSDQKWIRIKIAEDGYEGWIDKKQGYFISDSEFSQLNKENKSKTVRPFSKIKCSKGDFWIPAGSTLYLGGARQMLIGEHEFIIEENVRDISSKSPASDIIELALSYNNAPYLWGGKTHFGIDCSGFIQQVFGISGYFMPRDAWQQEQVGEEITITESKAGDLAFFKNEKGRIIHVGIILEKEKIIHASGQVRIDKLDKKGIFKKETDDYTHFLASIKRIIE